MKNKNFDSPKLIELTATYEQKSDSCQSVNDYQTLKISILDAGGGPFLVIETDRWAIDNINELVKILEPFNKMCKDSR